MSLKKLKDAGACEEREPTSLSLHSQSAFRTSNNVEAPQYSRNGNVYCHLRNMRSWTKSSAESKVIVVTRFEVRCSSGGCGVKFIVQEPSWFEF